jgi:glycerol-3-phosphate dehydrogenase (NAD(P)+)
VNDAVRAALASESLRVYATEDLTGLEWATALVGCLAIGVGYAQAGGVTAGLVAAYVSRAVGEAAKIAAAAGGDERTMLGLAGYGDLLACSGQSDRPEVRIGRALAEGRPLEAALREIGTRVEGVELIPRVVAFAEAERVACPIFRSLRDGILGAETPDAIVRALMSVAEGDRA